MGIYHIVLFDSFRLFQRPMNSSPMLKSRVIYCPFILVYHWIESEPAPVLFFFLDRSTFAVDKYIQSYYMEAESGRKASALAASERDWQLMSLMYAMDGQCWIYQRRQHVDHLHFELSQGFIRIRAVHGCQQQSTLIAGWWLLYKLQLQWLFSETHLQLEHG